MFLFLFLFLIVLYFSNSWLLVVIFPRQSYRNALISVPKRFSDNNRHSLLQAVNVWEKRQHLVIAFFSPFVEIEFGRPYNFSHTAKLPNHHCIRKSHFILFYRFVYNNQHVIVAKPSNQTSGTDALYSLLFIFTALNSSESNSTPSIKVQFSCSWQNYEPLFSFNLLVFCSKSTV